MQTMKQRAALSQRYDLNPKHFRFPRTEPASLRRVPWATEQKPHRLRDRVLWLVAVIGFAAVVAAIGGF